MLPFWGKALSQGNVLEFWKVLYFLIFLFVCLFKYLAVLGLHWGTQDLQFQHVGFSSLTRHQTQTAHIGNAET